MLYNDFICKAAVCLEPSAISISRYKYANNGKVARRVLKSQYMYPYNHLRIVEMHDFISARDKD